MRTIILFILTFAAFSCNQKVNKFDIIIPKPICIEKHDGEFILSGNTFISKDSVFGNVRDYFSEKLKSISGTDLISDSKTKNGIYFKKMIEPNDLGKEGYILQISKDIITITANETGGAFCGVQTLLQILSIDAIYNIPCGKITDKPRYAWRGFMIDPARKFIGKEAVLKLIDALALYKMNILHLHLSDDQGWRIEIESLPELTRTGSKANTIFNDQSSGFYSKTEMREIIEYAAIRNISIVPEIDMPGHSRAAITSYPELSCFGGPGKFLNSKTKNPRDSMPFHDPVCPGRETTFEFYEKVIGEIAELFPSEYIHIGGDETSKTCWKTCPHCQSVIKKENLSGVDGLQNYFAKRIQKIIESHGKKAMGWDELFETGAPSTFAVMAWREEQWGIEAANSDHKIVLAPCQYYYFNYSQAIDNERYYAVAAPFHLVYKHTLPVQDLNPQKASNIMGLEACHWGGADSLGIRMFESAFPRIIALAEKSWSENTDDYKDFLHRLSNQYAILDKMDIPYYIAHPEGLFDDVCYTDQYTVNLSVPVETALIRYTTDGSEPNNTSPVYTESFCVPIGTIVKTKTFLPNGKTSITVTGTSKKVKLIPEVKVAADLNPGLKVQIFKGKIYTLHNPSALVQVKDTVMSSITYPYGSMRLERNFGLAFSGYINIPADGVYSFHLTSCDGSNLFINGDTIVSDDYCHPRLIVVRRAALAKGIHPFHFDYFYSSIFEKQLLLEMAGPGMERQEIPEDMLIH